MRLLFKALFLSTYTLTIGCLSLFPGQSASAKATANEFRSLVRIEVPASAGKTAMSGSGIIIDQDGRVLTSYSAVSKLVKDKTTTATICVSKDEFSVPSCTLEATLLKTNAGSNLALLQIKRVLSENTWHSVEEEKLRNGFSFAHVALEKSTTTETLALGAEVSVLDYTLGSVSSLTQHTGRATGFERKLVKDKLTPWLVKTDIVSNQKSAGGAVLNQANQLVGIPTMATNTSNGYAAFTSLPVINTFLKEALGQNYLLNKVPFVFDGTFLGVLGGAITSSHCPESSLYDSSSKTCVCNNGFYAVGNACILGATYCQLVYPKQQSTYDIYLKACTCQINGETRICPENLRKRIVIPKPAPPTSSTTTKSITPTSTKPVVSTTKATTTVSVKPPSPSKTPSEIACQKKSGWTYIKKSNLCVPVGKLTKQTDLSSCEVVAVPATKLYFVKGNSFIKRMTYRNKECFADEATAQKAKYQKSATK